MVVAVSEYETSIVYCFMARSEEGIKFRHLVLKGWSAVELAMTLQTERFLCFLHPVEPGAHELEIRARDTSATGYPR